MKDVKATVAAQNAALAYVLPPNWCVGFNCPECGAMPQAPTCFLGMAEDCVRHNPNSYTQTLIDALRAPPRTARDDN